MENVYGMQRILFYSQLLRELELEIGLFLAQQKSLPINELWEQLLALRRNVVCFGYGTPARSSAHGLFLFEDIKKLSGEMEQAQRRLVPFL